MEFVFIQCENGSMVRVFESDYEALRTSFPEMKAFKLCKCGNYRMINVSECACCRYPHWDSEGEYLAARRTQMIYG